MSSEDTSMSPDASPVTFNPGKKRARRLNNIPLFILCVILAIVLGTMVMVAVKRAGKYRARMAEINVRSAAAQARELTRMAEGGIVEPVAPPPPPPEEPAPAVVTEPAAPEYDFAEEIRKARQKRVRLFEAALDSPIKVRVDETSLKTEPLRDSLAALEAQIAIIASQESMTYAERVEAIRRATEGGGRDSAGPSDLSLLDRYGRTTGSGWRNPYNVESPATRYIIRTGSVIPALLVSGINSDLPGQIIGQVSHDFYDSPTGNYLLIPQGSRLVGQYSADVQYGQSRVFVVWERLVFPDGKALDLGAMPGSSGAGYAGFRDRVNNHYLRVFGSAIMMSAILAGVEMTQNNQDYDRGSNKQRMSDALSEALGQQLGGVMAEMLRKNMNISPTLEIRPGYRFNVMLVKDLELTGVYRGFDYATGR